MTRINNVLVIQSTYGKYCAAQRFRSGPEFLKHLEGFIQQLNLLMFRTVYCFIYTKSDFQEQWITLTKLTGVYY